MKDLLAEKRAQIRYNVNDFVVAVFDKRIGRVINISKNGLALQLTDGSFEPIPDECITSLLSRSKVSWLKTSH